MFSLRNPGNFELFKLSQMKKQNKTKKHSLVKQALRLSKDIFSVFALLDHECIHWQIKTTKEIQKTQKCSLQEELSFFFFQLNNTKQRSQLFQRSYVYEKKTFVILSKLQ